MTLVINKNTYIPYRYLAEFETSMISLFKFSVRFGLTTQFF